MNANPSGESIPATAHEQALLRAVGERLRMLRRLAGRTEDDVAGAAGMSAELLRQVEAGRREPSLLTVRRIAPALGVTNWPQTLGTAESKATGQPAASRPARPSGEMGLHVHLHVTEDPTFHLPCPGIVRRSTVRPGNSRLLAWSRRTSLPPGERGPIARAAGANQRRRQRTPRSVSQSVGVSAGAELTRRCARAAEEDGVGCNTRVAWGRPPPGRGWLGLPPGYMEGSDHPSVTAGPSCTSGLTVSRSRRATSTVQFVPH